LKNILINSLDQINNHIMTWWVIKFFCPSKLFCR